MRKWMRDRLQRRKKKAAEQPKEAPPPPLQPAYFDAQPSLDSLPETKAQAEETAETSEPESSPSSFEPQAAAVESKEDSQSQVSGGRRTAESGTQRRPKRRRGGRGRGGRGREQAVARAFSPAAIKGSAPAIVPAEQPGVEEQPGTQPEPEAVSPAPVPSLPTIAATPRPPKGIVVLAIGLPGSGKSTWFKRHNVTPLSSDMLRTLLFDDVREQRYQDLVFSNLRSMLKARLIAKRPTNYVDATNLTPNERQHWIKLAKDYGYEVHAVFFDVPLEVCIERHQRRDRVVPDDVMRRMAAKLKPPSFEEGFAKITVVRVKKKEGE
jgi:predicted kinase